MTIFLAVAPGACAALSSFWPWLFRAATRTSASAAKRRRSVIFSASLAQHPEASEQQTILFEKFKSQVVSCSMLNSTKPSHPGSNVSQQHVCPYVCAYIFFTYLCFNCFFTYMVYDVYESQLCPSTKEIT